MLEGTAGEWLPDWSTCVQQVNGRWLMPSMHDRSCGNAAVTGFPRSNCSPLQARTQAAQPEQKYRPFWSFSSVIIKFGGVFFFFFIPSLLF